MVSVLIPVYNAARYVEDAVNSILHQTYSDLEILICDDKSQDDSLKIIRKFSDPRIKIFESRTNRGYLITINDLMSKAKGDYIAFQDADDISHPERIERQLQFLESNPEIMLVGTNYKIIDENGKTIKNFLNQVSEPEQVAAHLIDDNLFQKPSVMFRRKIHDKIGGFREGFLKLGNISEDYDWLLRASEHFSLANLKSDIPLYYYRSVTGAMSKSYLKIEQHVGHKVAKYLAKERANKNGIDSLMTEDWGNLAKQIETFAEPYKGDLSLFYYEKAESLIFAGLLKPAIVIAWRAVVYRPFKEKNWRCLLSALKKKWFE